MIWFISDPHFFHKNVIRMCKRPFENLHDMHESYIQEWNKRVKPNEKVYVLGDFAFAGWTLMKKVLDRLNGHKILITGNHDLAAHKMLAAGFQEVHENIWIEMGPDKQKVFLSHFPFHPMFSYNKYQDGSVEQKYSGPVDMRYLHKRIVDDGNTWLLHGHVHNAWRQNGRQINVGVDVRGHVPVSHEAILKIIEAGPAWDGESFEDKGD